MRTRADAGLRTPPAQAFGQTAVATGANAASPARQPHTTALAHCIVVPSPVVRPAHSLTRPRARAQLLTCHGPCSRSPTRPTRGLARNAAYPRLPHLPAATLGGCTSPSPPCGPWAACWPCRSGAQLLYAMPRDLPWLIHIAVLVLSGRHEPACCLRSARRRAARLPLLANQMPPPAAAVLLPRADPLHRLQPRHVQRAALLERRVRGAAGRPNVALGPEGPTKRSKRTCSPALVPARDTSSLVNRVFVDRRCGRSWCSCAQSWAARSSSSCCTAQPWRRAAWRRRRWPCSSPAASSTPGPDGAAAHTCRIPCIPYTMYHICHIPATYPRVAWLYGWLWPAMVAESARGDAQLVWGLLRARGRP